MSRASVITPDSRFVDNDGITPVASGTLTFYQKKSTKLASIYSDQELSSSQSNPYTLGTGGELDGDVRFAGTLTMVLKDSTGREVRTYDNASCFEQTSPYGDWDANTTYGLGGNNIVTGSDGSYYVSLQAANLGNDPISEPTWWELADILTGSAAAIARIDSIANITPSVWVLIAGDGTGYESGGTLGSLLRDNIDGVTTAIGSDASHDIDFTAGRCMDSTNSIVMEPAALTKQIDATWASGDAAGGLASGLTVANSTWYHLFCVKVGSSFDFMFDTSVVCQNGVDNNAVTHFRRIGSVLTDGSANLVKYFQIGNYFYWDVIDQDVATVNPRTSTVTPTLTVPLGVQVKAILMAVARKDGAQTVLRITSPDQADAVPTASNSQVIAAQANVTQQVYHQAMVEQETNTLSQIRYRLDVSTATTTVYINTLGWEDPR